MKYLIWVPLTGIYTAVKLDAKGVFNGKEGLVMVNILYQTLCIFYIFIWCMTYKYH